MKLFELVLFRIKLNDVETMANRIAFFWVGPDIAIPEYLVKSVRLTCGEATEVIQLTDPGTPEVPGVSRVIRGALSEHIMVARLQAYSNLELSVDYTYFCDADSIFINSLQLDSSDDILLSPRVENHKINPYYPEHYPEFEGKMIMEVMPFLFGAMAVRGENNIFKGLLRKCLKLPPRFHRWYGDQVALAKSVGAGNFNYGHLDPAIYLKIISKAPTSSELEQLIRQNVQMVTFKGPSIDKISNLSQTFEVLRSLYRRIQVRSATLTNRKKEAEDV